MSRKADLLCRALISSALLHEAACRRQDGRETVWQRKADMKDLAGSARSLHAKQCQWNAMIRSDAMRLKRLERVGRYDAAPLVEWQYYR